MQHSSEDQNSEAMQRAKLPEAIRRCTFRRSSEATPSEAVQKMRSRSSTEVTLQKHLSSIVFIQKTVPEACLEATSEANFQKQDFRSKVSAVDQVGPVLYSCVSTTLITTKEMLNGNKLSRINMRSMKSSKQISTLHYASGSHHC